MIDPAIFKANDIRGITGNEHSEWDADGAYVIGAATADVLAGNSGWLVIGRDIRPSSAGLAAAFADGVRDHGVAVIDAGLTSTDQLWYSSGSLDIPGVMFTASHNPSQYNGIKFCLAGARPVTSQMLVAIRDRALLEDPACAAAPGVAPDPGAAFPPQAKAALQHRSTLSAYADHLHSLVDFGGAARLRVVVDAGNGMAAHTLPVVLTDDIAEVIGLHTELDGTFPNHPPNPLEPGNLVEAQQAVVDHHADLALVFDGDADRCFVIDEQGQVVEPSTMTAMIAAVELRREPGSTVVVNQITSRSVGEVVAEYGGRCVVTRVGHTFVKAAMADQDAIFGGEHSAHYYFRDFWRADTGMLAALHVLAMCGKDDRPLSRLAAQFSRYVASGELNSQVDDVEHVMARVAEQYKDSGAIDDTDGITVSAQDWWFNLRPSNTEPLLRLNVESVTQSITDRLCAEVLAAVRR